MEPLCKNAISFLQKRFPVAPVVSQSANIHTMPMDTSTPMWSLIALDTNAGIKQRAIAIHNLGSIDELATLANSALDTFKLMDESVYMKVGNIVQSTGHDIDTTQMTTAPRIILYTDKLQVPIDTVIRAFSAANLLVEVVEEAKIHKTLFISYGAPDAQAATKINTRLKALGITTWYFPVNAKPGEKLHRVMHEGVNKYDHVLLICSQNSLSRPGVLNEIERALEREAREGGSSILIPVTLDDYVYGEWAPSRNDIAEQIRSRVITKLKTGSKIDFDEQVKKIVDVLTK